MFCVQVGANDGKINDPVHRYLTGYGWRGLLVEPQVDVFEQELTKTYAGYNNVTLVNVALAPTEGSLPFYRVAISKARWATGLSSFRKENLERHIANGYIRSRAEADGLIMPSKPEEVIEVVRVPTISVRSLLDRHHVEKFDVLCIDTEGYDFEILKMFDFGVYKPDLVLFESKHLSDQDYVTAQTLLTDAGYALYWDSGDTLAVRSGSRAEKAAVHAGSAIGKSTRFVNRALRKVRNLFQ